MKLIEVKISDIKPHPKNPRIHPDSAINKLVDSINHYGWTNPLLISKDGFLIAGHARVKAAEQAGPESAPAIILELSADDAIAYMIADNRLQDETKWDMPLLDEVLKELENNKYNLELTGFDISEINDLFSDSMVDDLKDDDFDLEKELEEIIEPITKLGDKWILGNHVLVCGDSGNEDVYKKLLDEETVDMMITDPPYNVNYSNKAGAIMNDNMKSNDFYLFLDKCFSEISKQIIPGGGIYIFYGFGEVENFISTATKNNLYIKQNLIWVKNHFNLGRQDYQWKHEPILYGWKKGAAHKWYGGFDKATVMEEESKLEKMKKSELIEFIKKILSDIPKDIIHYDKSTKNTMHPTMKPVPLVGQLINNSSRQGGGYSNGSIRRLRDNLSGL